MLLCAVAFVVVTGPAQASAPARLSEAYTLAARQENGAAIDIYKDLLAHGSDGRDLRYNLGTLCLLQNDLGCAVLHLRAAQRMAPGDDDVAHNLAIAVEQRVDRLDEGTVASSPVRALGARVSSLTARMVLAVPLGVLALALALLPWWPRGRRVLLAMLALSAVASVVGGVVLGARVVVEHMREGVVQKAEVSARKEPDAAAAEAFVAHAGLSGEIVDEQGGYARMRFENGLEAWLPVDALAVLESL